ncbi:MAG: glycoside hydrolase family 2 protein, partial [Bariatricus sp.]
MSTKMNWNPSWLFSKENSGNTSWEEISLPHTWNGTDGQDGGDDYYRGTCYYKKFLKKRDLPEGEEFYIEFEGVNSSGVLYVNGAKAASHDGGYSTWRANITEYLQEENEILVAVDNAPNDHVYPQKADFTFYGGIYRNVNLIGTSKTRFDLDYFGGPGITVTPIVDGDHAFVKTEVFLTGDIQDAQLHYQILDGDVCVAERTTSADTRTSDLTIEHVHLWNGRKDPHLYTLHVTLCKNKTILDERTLSFGCRTFEIDPEKGFILNGVSYPLHGVSRHQDRPVIGNALLPEHHEEDPSSQSLQNSVSVCRLML